MASHGRVSALALVPCVGAASAGTYAQRAPRVETVELGAGETVPFTDGPNRNVATVWTPVGRAATSGRGSSAYGISNRGWIVGTTGVRPALWLIGQRLIELPTPGAIGLSRAVDVNDAGHIIGLYSRESIGLRSFLWIVR